MSEQNMSIQERWFKPVNRIGRITESIAIIASFFPWMYLYFTYGEMPPMGTILVGMGTVTAAYIAAWIVEPISYFPALGTAGTYMGILAGSIGQMRVPSALVAKSVAGVQENTQEAEIVATCGIAGSIYMNVIILTITAVGGSVILAYMPKVILDTLSEYVLPAMFGAVLAMFCGGKGRLLIVFPVLILATALHWMINGKIIPVPAWCAMLIMVILGVIVSRILYKIGAVKA